MRYGLVGVCVALLEEVNQCGGGLYGQSRFRVSPCYLYIKMQKSQLILQQHVFLHAVLFLTVMIID